MISSQPDAGGHFGPYGGRYVPEVLMSPLEELERTYEEARVDPAFQAELADLLKNFAGRPTPLYLAKRLTAHFGGAKIYIKREDLLHTGAHKINNCPGQALLADGWASIASSRKRGRGSMAWPRPLCARCSASIARFTWGKKTCGGRA